MPYSGNSNFLIGYMIRYSIMMQLVWAKLSSVIFLVFVGRMFSGDSESRFVENKISDLTFSAF